MGTIIRYRAQIAWRIQTISSLRCLSLALSLLMLIPPSASAQEFYAVRYSHTFPVLYGAGDAALEHLMAQEGAGYTQGPSHATVLRTLVISPDASLMYRTVRQNIIPGTRTGWEYIDTTYVQFDANAYTESREFFGDTYLVKDERPVLSWRVLSEERLYLGYRVMKATAMLDSISVEAWFAPEISVPAGPGLYGGLPGLILLLTNVSTGEVYSAEAVMITEELQITTPTAGREVSNRRYSQVKTSELAADRSYYDETKRLIEEGRMTVRRRNFDVNDPLGNKKKQ